MRLHPINFGAAAMAVAAAVSAGAAEPGKAPAMPVAQTQPAGGPVYNIAYLEVGAPSAKPTVALLRAFGEASRKENGALAFDVLVERDRPTRFAVVAEWRDNEALAAHRAAAGFKSYRDKVQPMLAAPPDVRPDAGLDVAAPAGGGGREAVFVVTHVDVVPTFKDQAAQLLRGLAAASRKAAGNLRCDVLVQASRANHFTLVEAWRTDKAFEAYRIAPATLDFREKLLPMEGALYDERVYSQLR